MELARAKDFKALYHYFYKELTFPEKTKIRTIYHCIIDPSSNCKFQLYSVIPRELNRFFIHLSEKHADQFSSAMLCWLENNHVQNFQSVSCSELICKYMTEKILPLYLNKKKNSNFQDKIIENTENCENLMDLSKIDLTRINQVILENGIYENQPQSVLTSDNHSNIYGQCIILGYELGRNTKISNQQLLQIVNNSLIPRSLLKSVGNDYFLASINPFQEHPAAFEIDAGKINQRCLLVFVLSSKQSDSLPILFDFIDNFDSSKKNYRNAVRKMILKASEI